MKHSTSHLTLPSIYLATATMALSAGFQLQERSTSGLGRAFAGEAAIAEDASAIATNAASMLLLDGTQVSAGASYVMPSVKVSGTFNGIPTADPGPAQEALVPYAYISHKLNEDWALGLALHARFGLSTDYADSFLATSLAKKSEITTVYISPKLAYQINQAWSIGAGFDAVNVDATLTNAIPSPVPGLGGATVLDVSGDDWAYGFNLGTMYQCSERTRFGLAYYSKVDFTLEGQARTDTGFPGVLPPTSTTSASAKSTLPQSIELSGFHSLNDKWDLHASFTWTDWSVFDELLINTINGDLPPTPEKWKDVYRVAAGATYHHNDRWTFRAGLAFDESPVPSAELRTLRIPDSDRFWLSAGTTYNINQCYSVDLGYTHIFAKTVQISEGAFQGRAEGHVNLVGLSFNGKF
ncbi:OmpP1/FadL family transporter [Rubritalea tangerina]|uniref:OmpP1/FadL family transporter n=2 Tax=Rubritalea tangerina TaxID=430798 RepID=A0ABW4ZCR3_9BACT